MKVENFTTKKSIQLLWHKFTSLYRGKCLRLKTETGFQKLNIWIGIPLTAGTVDDRLGSVRKSDCKHFASWLRSFPRAYVNPGRYHACLILLPHNVQSHSTTFSLRHQCLHIITQHAVYTSQTTTRTIGRNEDRITEALNSANEPSFW